jgi:hypothetical protein
MLNNAGLGQNIFARLMPIIPAQPIPNAPPHIKNYSLGALYATKPRPPTVIPVANIAS